jgi:hypothetical protein
LIVSGPLPAKKPAIQFTPEDFDSWVEELQDKGYTCQFEELEIA